MMLLHKKSSLSDLVSFACYPKVLSCVVLLFAFSGCGGAEEGPARFDVKGTVTFDGQPVERGDIQFIPDSAKGNEGPATSTEIVNGEFTTVESANGVVGGPHKVKITGFDGNADPENELPYGVPLFQGYEVDEDFPAASEENSGEPKTLTFDVPQSAQDK